MSFLSIHKENRIIKESILQECRNLVFLEKKLDFDYGGIPLTCIKKNYKLSIKEQT